VFSFRFDRPLVISENDTSARILHCIGFPSHDTKQGLILSGQGTAADSCSCLTCIALAKEFWKPQEWMEKYDQGNGILKRVGAGDAPLREGEYSNRVLYERFKEVTDDGNYKLSNKGLLKVRQTEVYSVDEEPCLYTPVRKDPLCPMHTMQGHITHLLQATRDELRIVDSQDSVWLRRVEQVLEEVELLAKESADFRANHKRSDSLKKKIAALDKKLKTQQRLRNPKQEVIDSLRQQISSLKAERKEHARDSGMEELMLLALTRLYSHVVVSLLLHRLWLGTQAD
jgi:hypothetical protein